MARINTFSKGEHLCGEIRVGKLFSDGKAFIVYPFRIVYKTSSGSSAVPAKILISVPKKRFKHAVDRNRIKRLMRESYRLNKTALLETMIEKQKTMDVAFNYVADIELDFATMHRKMEKAITQLIEKI